MEKGKILNLLNELKENGKIKDYLGYGETYAIIERIMTVPELTKEAEQISEQFWKDVREKGLYMYSDEISPNNFKEQEENIKTRYITDQNLDNVPAIVYEFQKGKSLVK